MKHPMKSNLSEPEQINKVQREKPCLLSSAPDWQLETDLKKQLKFLKQIAETALSPDWIIFSNSTKQIIQQLSVPL